MLVRMPYRTTSLTPEARRSATRFMKRTRNRHCEQGMKYFTPELYQQFNSLDKEVAERADKAWDHAEIAYRERLAHIREGMPSEVVKLSQLCLHDALVVSREERAEPTEGTLFFDSPN